MQTLVKIYGQSILICDPCLRSLLWSGMDSFVVTQHVESKKSHLCRFRVVGAFVGCFLVASILLMFSPFHTSHVELSGNTDNSAMVASNIKSLEALHSVEEAEREVVDAAAASFKDPKVRVAVANLLSSKARLKTSNLHECSKPHVHRQLQAVILGMKKKVQEENSTLVSKMHDLHQLASKAKADWTNDQMEYSHDHDEYDVNRNALQYSLLRYDMEK